MKKSHLRVWALSLAVIGVGCMPFVSQAWWQQGRMMPIVHQQYVTAPYWCGSYYSSYPCPQYQQYWQYYQQPSQYYTTYSYTNQYQQPYQYTQPYYYYQAYPNYTYQTYYTPDTSYTYYNSGYTYYGW